MDRNQAVRSGLIAPSETAPIKLDATPSVLLRGAVILGHTAADALLVRNGQIEAIGVEADLRRLTASDARTIDCGDRLVTPGLHDAHAHLFALAAEQHGADCGSR